MDFREEIAKLIGGRLEVVYSASIPGIAEMLEIPPSADMGDYAFPCFKLARDLKKAPPAIAAQLAAGFECGFLEKVEQNGGYLNFFIEDEFYARSVVESILADPEGYGSDGSGRGKTVCIDYSSINISKRFHMGHLLNTAIGHSLERIYSFLGYKTVSINHLGDWGTQFGKLVAAYRKWGDEKAIAADPMTELTRLYVRFHDEAERDRELDALGRTAFKAIEDGEPEAMAIYQNIKDMTLDYANGILKMLDISFDSYDGEAFFYDKTAPVVDELREKGLLRESEGAQIVDLEPYGMPPCIILRSDGATLYHTRDIAAAFYRKKTYRFDKLLYVVAYQQNLHFQQFFKVIELMGYEWAKDMEHVAHGMVSMEDGAMSTRHGKVIYLEDVFSAAIAKAEGIMLEKSPDLPDLAEVAKQVGIGAVLFSALYNGRIKDVVFSWDRALNFDGETGPYVQYTNARCASVLSKADKSDFENPRYSALCDPYAQALVSALEKYSAVVAEAAERNEPSLLTRQIVKIAQAYNKFYFENRILDDDRGTRAARLALTRAAKAVIANGLYLIGLKAPERM